MPARKRVNVMIPQRPVTYFTSQDGGTSMALVPTDDRGLLASTYDTLTLEGTQLYLNCVQARQLAESLLAYSEGEWG